MAWNTQNIKGVQWSGLDRHEDWVDYLDRYPDVMEGAQRWLNNQNNTHWANYVRQRKGMFDDFQENTKYGLPAGHDMWSYGYNHAKEFGYKTNRDNWKVLGSGDMKRGDMAIGDDIYDFAKWHWETTGHKEANRTLRDMDDVRKAEAIQKENDRRAKEALFEQMMSDERTRQMESAAQAQEAGRLSSLRIGSSNTLGSAGAATIKPKSTSSAKKGSSGRGTDQFKRPYAHSSGLSIAGTGNTSSGVHNI